MLLQCPLAPATEGRGEFPVALFVGSMLDNAPVRSENLAGILVEGYSRAAVQTYWRLPELKIGFDLGGQPWSFMASPVYFVSHGHLDHIAAIPSYVSRRRMMKMEPPIIYLPEHLIDPVDKLLKLFQKLDRGRMPCDLRPAVAGEDIEVSRELVVTPYPTTHSVPSLGYILWERRKKLKQEYLGLTGDQIRNLKFSGVEITEEKRIPLVAFTGDTSAAGLDRHPANFTAKVLITELTFVAKGHRRDRIQKYGHIHLDDIIERRGQFQNEVIVASHFSTRYQDDRFARIVHKRLPDMLDGRLLLWF